MITEPSINKPFSSMSPSSSSSKTLLNPHAPEYKPISQGITPNPVRNFSLLSLLENAAVSSPPPPPPPRPFFVSTHIFTYMGPPLPPPFYVTTRTPSHYFPRQQNSNDVNRQPEAARFGHGQRQRTSFGLRRGSPAGGRGSGRGLMMNERQRVITNVPNNKNNTNSKSVWMKKKEEEKKEEVKHEVVVPLNRDEEKTTVMIKNIPYHCPRDQLMNMLDRFCMTENAKAMNEGGTSTGIFEECAYDFVYLPIDFRTRRSRGFAFVNFTNATTVWKFFNTFHSTHWDFVERTSWPKKIEIVSAKFQGKEALVNHFAGSKFRCETEEYLPVWFNPARDGSGLPVEGIVVGKRRAISHGASTRRGRKHKTLRPGLFK